MEYLKDLLPIIIYVLLIVLIILLIIFTVKAIKTLKKVDGLVDNVDKKVRALDGVFEVVDLVSNKFQLGVEKAVDFVSGAFSKLFSKKKKDEIEEDE